MYKVTDMDHFGRGIIKKDGKIVFINGALPGEEVNIEVYSSKKRYEEADVLEIENQSKYRREVPCPYYKECGGCDIMHMTYEGQKEFKIDKIKNILKKYADLEVEPNFVSCENEFNYRNKIVLHKGKKGYGFYKKNTKDIVYINDCKIAKKELNDCIKVAKDKNEVTFRNCDNGVISNIFESSEDFKTINGIKFKLNVNSFFQVNDYIADKLFHSVEDSIKEDSIVLDLYAGVGTLSLCAAKNAKKVYSIEINEYASSNAKENVINNRLSNVEVINGDVSKILKSFNKPFDTVIIDPPRSGLDEFTTSFILDKKPNMVIYVSCDPMSLARDLSKLKEVYEIKDVTIFDMFPNTYHTECKVVLEKK